jgi:hypothetical protein
MESHYGVHSAVAYRSLKTCTLNSGVPISQHMAHFTHRDTISQGKVQFAYLLRGVRYKQDGVYFAYRGTNLSKQSLLDAWGINISNQGVI